MGLLGATPEYLKARVEAFNDSQELSDALRRISETMKANKEYSDAYFLDETSEHIIGLYTEFKKCVSETIRLRRLLEKEISGDDFLDIDDVCAIIGISPKTLADWNNNHRHKKILAPIRYTSKVVRYKHKDVMAFIEKCRSSYEPPERRRKSAT